MGTPWDRAATRYLDEWVPRFVPYHLDLVRELSLMQGQRVLVPMAGSGAEVLAIARVVGDKGKVRATDTSAEMIRICREQVEKAYFNHVTCAQGEATDVGDGGWNAIVCAFGLWRFPNCVTILNHWRSALATNGKVGVLTWGPIEDGDPYNLLTRALTELEPGVSESRPRINPSRESMHSMFEEAGLSLVRLTVIRHTVSFTSAEAFLSSLSEGSTWRKISEELGPQRMARVAARFFDQIGGLTVPLTFQPAATLAIAALPGAAIDLAVRSSVKAPPLSSSNVVATRAPNDHEQWQQKISHAERAEPPPSSVAPKKRH
ncbi:MAG: class I SAM-dependent methyltransferase [Polyangiaceae bacterium]|nr:class I SAM-dependent methyltransferase [Polyangiaceae bacterium]